MNQVSRVVVGLAVAVALAGCAKGYRVERRVDDLRVTLSCERYPLELGRSTLAVEVADLSGNAVEGASVRVRYGLPAMPGMGEASYDAMVTRVDQRWDVSADFHTVATWNVEVTVERPGRPPAVATFSL